MFIDFKREEGRGAEKEREGEKHQLVAFHTHSNWGSNPQPFGVWDKDAID